MNDEQRDLLADKLDRLSNKIVNLNGLTRFDYQLQLQRHYDDYLARPKYQEQRRLLRHGYKVYSQNDEDGIIAEIFRRIGTEHKVFVEFGAERGIECNTLNLTLSGWRGLWMDGSSGNVAFMREKFDFLIAEKQLAVVRAMIDAENINGLISENIGQQVDLLSIDIDRNDYWVWKAIDVIQPRLVVIEYNATIRPPVAVTVKYDAKARWNGTNYFGASLSALEKLGRDKGYSLVGCTFSGANAFFVRDDLLGDHFCTPFTAENHYEPPRYHVWLTAGHRADFGPFVSV